MNSKLSHTSFPIWILALGTVAMGVDSFVVAGILPQVGTELGIQPASAGQLITVFALTYALSAPLTSIWTSHFSQSRVIKAALIIFIIANVLTAVSPSFTFVLCSRILAGFAAALFTPNASAAAALLATPQTRGKALSIIVGGLTLGTVFGVPIGTLIGQAASWRATFAFVATIAFLALVGIHLRLPLLQPSLKVPLSERIRAITNLRIVQIVVFMCLSSAASIGVYTFIAEIMKVQIGATEQTLALLLSFWGMGGVVGSFGSGIATDRYGANKTLVVTSLLLTATFGLLLFNSNLVTAAILLFLNGLASWAIASPNNHRLTELIPNLRSVVISYNSSGIYLGQAIGVGLAGLLLANGLAPQTLPAFGLVLTLASLMVLYYSIRSTES